MTPPAPAAALPLLSVRDLAVRFDADAGPVDAVRGVSFDLFGGRTLAVVGESGSGKSVTAQSILRILGKRASITAGTITFRDPADGVVTEVTRHPADAPAMLRLRGARIGMIFQEPMTSLSPLHTVGDQVGEALLLHRPVTRQEADERVEALLARVGFPDPARARRAYPFELSGGQRQRAMIAMALICGPALLIADEPTTALDVTTQAGILDLMNDLRADGGLGVLLITHDLGVVASVADDVVVMYRGRVVEAGPRAEVMADPGHPYLQALMRAVPRFDMPRGTRLTPIREAKVEGAALLAVGPRRGPAPGAPVLLARGVGKSFEARKGAVVRALDDVSFALPAGRTLGVVGESGSGKTTLAKVVMRAIQPTEGRVLYDDGSGLADVAGLEGPALLAYRRAVQFVFQDPFSSLNPRMTVLDILAEPLRVHGWGSGGDERYERVKALLGLVGLDARALRRYPHSFSGGQRQRLGLARALALQPAAILCDEPTSALDVSVQAGVLNLFKDLQKALGLSYLFISHNLAVIDYVADSIVVMCRGRIVEEAPTQALFRDPRHPYTRALLAAVPSVDHRLDFAALRGKGFSDPAAWAAPYKVTEDAVPSLVEVAPGHRVRCGPPLAAPLARAS